MLRSTDPSRPLASDASEAVSANDVVWRQDSCAVTGLYEIAAVRGIIPAVIVRAHPGLQLVARDDGSPPAEPLGDGRYLVPLAEPAAGRVRLELSFTMPLADPVGVFEVPGAWLEGVATDLRTVRCAADPDLDVTPELPAGVSLLRPREEDGPGVVAVWRSDAVAASAESVSGGAVAEEAAVEGERPRARVAVRRLPSRCALRSNSTSSSHGKRSASCSSVRSRLRRRRSRTSRSTCRRRR